MSTGMISDSRIQHSGGAAFVFGNLLYIANKLNEMSRLFLGRPMPDVISGQNPTLIILGQGGPYHWLRGLLSVLLPACGAVGQECAPPAQRRRYPVDVWPCQFHVQPRGLHIAFFSALCSVAVSACDRWFAVLAHRPDLVRHTQLAPVSFEPLALAAIGYRLTGFIGFVLLRGAEITAIFLFFRTLFALGLIGLGVTLWLEKSVQPEVIR